MGKAGDRCERHAAHQSLSRLTNGEVDFACGLLEVCRLYMIALVVKFLVLNRRLIQELGPRKTRQPASKSIRFR